MARIFYHGLNGLKDGADFYHGLNAGLTQNVPNVGANGIRPYLNDGAYFLSRIKRIKGWRGFLALI
jgi:hypothetical protein